MKGNQFFMKADSTNKVAQGGRGRSSNRIVSQKSYLDSVIVLDVVHMPEGCATWPAFWTVTAGQWPKGGEIDIIEGVLVYVSQCCPACSWNRRRQQQHPEPCLAPYNGELYHDATSAAVRVSFLILCILWISAHNFLVLSFLRTAMRMRTEIKAAGLTSRNQTRTGLVSTALGAAGMRSSVLKLTASMHTSGAATIRVSLKRYVLAVAVS